VVTRKSILLVEDDKDLSEVLCFNLQREGYDCRCVTDGQSALDEVQRSVPDLVVLDRMLPKTSGDRVASELRRNPLSASVPIIMLTAKAEEVDELVGFALGADDYVTKPFKVKALMARISAVLRRQVSTEPKVEHVTVGPFQMDVGRRDILVEGTRVSDLTATEFKILRALMTADGRVLTRTQLIDAVLGPSVAVTDRTIDVHITALRRKLSTASPGSQAAGWVQTVRGVGYTFRRPG
jgi:two-component system phosphate regulon response regulator PhoB